MLKHFSEQIFTDLSSFSGLTNRLDEDGIRPLLGELSDGNSFVTYYVKYLGNVTKDSGGGYQVVILSWSTTYDRSIQIADAVSEALKASENVYSYESGEPRFSEQNEIYTQQIFNIKQ